MKSILAFFGLQVIPPTETASAPSVASAEKNVRALLTNGQYTWRSIEALSKASGLSQDDTRNLLSEIGARRSELEKEVYTLDLAEGTGE